MSKGNTVRKPAPPPVPSSFRTALLAEIPHLRAFAVSLSGSFSLADDLVQETLLKAWSHAASFLPGTNLRAWLFTILRNCHYSFHRKYRHEIADADGIYAAQVAVQPSQQAHLDMLDLRQALLKLPLEQREALVMVGAMGLSHEEAALICAVAPGTIKSRLSRGRVRLAELLGLPLSGLPEDGVPLAALPNLPVLR
jgi:RNA polymerase sigma-70 factor (ECF subfamily)